MSDSQLTASLAAASFLAQQEQFRHHIPEHPGPADVTALTDSSSSPSQASDDLMAIWRLLPNLRGLPDALLRKLSPEAVFQLNSALGKDLKTSAKLTVNARLAQNAKRIAANPVAVEAGRDNRKDILHPARFLGGATCSNSELWLLGKQHLGDSGIIAMGNYDLDSVGCGGCVTPKGWEALHNPSSQELKLKMFYLPNVTGNGLAAKRVNLESGEEALSIGDSLKEIADLEGYKAALNTAREAMHSVLPWNRSICAIVGFMTNTNYLQEDLRNNTRRAAVLSEFTDYIFGRNALNWENGHQFLSTDELAQAWAQWKGKRAMLFAGKTSEKPWQKEKKSTICRRFNSGNCPKQTEKECKSFFGATLRHVCNKYVGPGKQCEKDHSRADHK